MFDLGKDLGLYTSTAYEAAGELIAVAQGALKSGEDPKRRPRLAVRIVAGSLGPKKLSLTLTLGGYPVFSFYEIRPDGMGGEAEYDSHPLHVLNLPQVAVLVNSNSSLSLGTGRKSTLREAVSSSMALEVAPGTIAPLGRRFTLLDAMRLSFVQLTSPSPTLSLGLGLEDQKEKGMPAKLLISPEALALLVDEVAPATPDEQMNRLVFNDFSDLSRLLGGFNRDQVVAAVYALYGIELPAKSLELAQEQARRLVRSTFGLRRCEDVKDLLLAASKFAASFSSKIPEGADIHAVDAVFLRAGVAPPLRTVPRGKKLRMGWRRWYRSGLGQIPAGASGVKKSSRLTEEQVVESLKEKASLIRQTNYGGDYRSSRYEAALRAAALLSRLSPDGAGNYRISGTARLLPTLAEASWNRFHLSGLRLTVDCEQIPELDSLEIPNYFIVLTSTGRMLSSWDFTAERLLREVPGATVDMLNDLKIAVEMVFHQSSLDQATSTLKTPGQRARETVDIFRACLDPTRGLSKDRVVMAAYALFGLEIPKGLGASAIKSITDHLPVGDFGLSSAEELGALSGALMTLVLKRRRPGRFDPGLLAAFDQTATSLGLPPPVRPKLGQSLLKLK